MATAAGAAAVSFVLCATTAAAPPERVTMTLDPVAYGKPGDATFTGRVYLCMVPESTDTGGTANAARAPMQRMHDWFDTVPLASWDVAGLAPGEPITFEGFGLLHMDEEYRERWGAGVWRAQAIARVDPDSPKAGRGAGDLYSPVFIIDMNEPAPRVDVRLSNRVQPGPMPETDRVRHFQMRSNLLSAFHGRDVQLNAGVYLPDSWDQPSEDGTPRRYPIVYCVTGFGGSHEDIAGYVRMLGGDELIGEAIVVVPDATNVWGHSVFANSEVTGPWGDALVEELAPALEAVFRGPTDPAHRYVTGISSGGWSSLWLQVVYPEAFGGCWSHVPDPVDFRAFQTVDIEADAANFYRDEQDQRRPIARRGDAVLIHADDFIDRETVLGPGGQIESFEAVFSPALADGTPMRLFDRETGGIHPATARAWRAYDIRRVLEQAWAGTRDALAGKIRVYGGGADNFYLGESVALLAEAMTAMGVRLGSMDEPAEDGQFPPEADIRVIDGLTHRTYRPGVSGMWRTIHERWAAPAH